MRDRGAQQYIFDETKRIGEITFDFLDKSAPMNYSSRLASKMQKFDSEESLPHLIKHTYIVEKFDKELT